MSHFFHFYVNTSYAGWMCASVRQSMDAPIAARDTAGAGARGKKGPQKAVGRAPAIRSMLASFFAAPGLRIASGPSTGT